MNIRIVLLLLSCLMLVVIGFRLAMRDNDRMVDRNEEEISPTKRTIHDSLIPSGNVQPKEKRPDKFVGLKSELFKDELLRLIEDSKDDSSMLAGMLSLDADPDLILPHLRRMPDNNMARLMIALRSKDAKEIKEAAEWLASKSDSKGLGVSLLLKQSAEAGDQEAVSKYLNMLTTAGSVEWPVGEIQVAALDVIRKLGRDTAWDQLVASNSSFTYDYHKFVTPVIKMWETFDEEEREARVTEFLAVTSAGSASHSLNTINSIAFMQSESRILDDFPSDSEYGESGITVGERLAILKSEMLSLSDYLVRFENNAPSLSESELQAFIDRKIRLGEQEAIKWAVREFDL